ncbi:4370_t:CDS:2 [Paraglomus brasilianum]|uniref:4370_t:CDS:1 n=1 Tax=Paraglomus brasilianum TaxID=144538 RepID=A0A9N9H3Q3_9GLOM|nr:4370_t:CDS:2 [Paraglomus brasilianum]
MDTVKERFDGIANLTDIDMCLQSTSQFYVGLADVQGKLHKVRQKDFDILTKFWDKYSKKAIKDERAHDNNVANLDKLIKKTGKDYESK